MDGMRDPLEIGVLGPTTTAIKLLLFHKSDERNVTRLEKVEETRDIQK